MPIPTATPPTICRLVHYVVNAPRFAAPPVTAYQKPDWYIPECRAGIVVGATDTVIACFVMPAAPSDLPGVVQEEVPFDETLAAGTWHWPTACPAERAQ